MADTDRQPLVWRVKALAEAIEGSDVGELDLTEEGVRILIKRHQDPVVLPSPTDMRAPVRRATPQRRAHANGAAAPSANGAAAPEPGVAVVAPLTGVFYSAPSPNSSAFAQVGDPIQPGQVVCIVEAMKVFNEIKAEVSGTVTAILPKDGQLVQKGDALIRVKPV